MREDRRSSRRDQIEAAAHAVLLERGYAGASMLEVARRARASNETLYKWYGDKHGLFAEMVKRNAAKGLERLDQAITGPGDVETRLTQFAVALLSGILSGSAVELNRAAAADPSGQLGRTIGAHGREAVMPRLAAMLSGADIGPGFADGAAAAETFITLLVGDLQARRIIGTLPEPDAGFIQRRTATALRQFMTLARG